MRDIEGRNDILYKIIVENRGAQYGFMNEYLGEETAEAARKYEEKVRKRAEALLRELIDKKMAFRETVVAEAIEGAGATERKPPEAEGDRLFNSERPEFKVLLASMLYRMRGKDDKNIEDIKKILASPME